MNIRYLENVSTAKKSLIIWFSNIEQMHKGIKMFSEENTLLKEDTLFGKWYLGEGQVFSSFESFRAIEEPYTNLYNQFINYLELYHKPVTKSFFSNQKEKRKTELAIQFNSLRENKDKLLELVTSFEDNLKQSLLFKDDFKREEKVKKNQEQVFLNDSPKEKEIYIKKDVKAQEIKKQETSNILYNKSTNESESPEKQNTNKPIEIDIEEEIRRILN